MTSEEPEAILESFYVREIIGRKVVSKGRKIGHLSDLVLREYGSSPEITHFYVQRFFGRRSLLLPWESVLGVYPERIEVVQYEPTRYKREEAGDLLLRKFILNKKVIDLGESEIKVVSDLLMSLRCKKLLITDAEVGRPGPLYRTGFGRFALSRRKKETETALVPWSNIQPLPAPGAKKKDLLKLHVLKEKLEKMHPADLADIIEEMDPDQRVMIFTELDTSTASDTLEEIDPPIQREIVSSLKSEYVSDLIEEMTPGQTADILTALPYPEAEGLLNTLDAEKQKKVRSILEHAEEVIDNFTTAKFIMLPPEMQVGEVQDEYPRLAKGKDMIMYIYVVDDAYVLHGVVDIKELLQADDQAKLIDIMVDDVITLTPESTLKEASELFARYDFRALPVVDTEFRLIGVVPYRDVMRLKHHFTE